MNDTGISADDVVAGIEMILGWTPDQNLIDYHLRLGFSTRYELGNYLTHIEEFKVKYLGIEPSSNNWDEKAQRANERKQRLKTFGSHAFGVLVDTKHGFFVVDPERRVCIGEAPGHRGVQRKGAPTTTRPNITG